MSDYCWDPDDGTRIYANPDHHPNLKGGQYVIKHRVLGLFFACSPLNERESHFTQNIDEARRWSAEYLNRTAWDWSLECEAVAC